MIPYEKQSFDRIETPEVPDDIQFLGEKLHQVAHWTKKVYDALRRQESPNPTYIDLSPGVLGGSAPGVYQSTARIRGQWLLFSGGTAADLFGLKVGNGIRFRWFGGTTPFFWPFPEVVEPGLDMQVVDITTPGAVNWTAMVIGVVELEDRDD